MLLIIIIRRKRKVMKNKIEWVNAHIQNDSHTKETKWESRVGSILSFYIVVVLYSTAIHIERGRGTHLVLV